MNYGVIGQQMIHLAQAFATGAHGAAGQKRKYTGEDYIHHPAAVAGIVAQCPGHTWQMVAAAWLHDVVEDTHITIEVVNTVFGDDVSRLVAELTNVPKEAGNRRTRFALNLEKLSKASNEAKTIKLADIIHNISSIVANDPKFAPLYLEEKEQALKVLRGGDKVLWAIADDRITAGQQALVQNALAG